MRISLFFLTILITCHLSAQDLDYYLPDSISYNASIPKPKDVVYHNVGEWHITHDRLVNYMYALANATPDRIRIENMGLSYESRPQVLLIITSPENHKNLEQIRLHHLKLSDPSQSASLNTASMPLVVYIGHSIHGNESSGANAALLSAYYLAAAKGKQVDELLQNTIILLDPAFNPDGLQRFSTWANQHKSKNLVTDANSREFHEVWPGGRYNHYWFDLNRDWLPAQHVESQNRLEWFHKWKPNILTDHHEQGSNATFFFQPGVPSRVNPITPARNQELTASLAKFHAAFLDRIGSLYFTKENYDDFYYGKGSTYPDVNGSIGILFEQASSRGHAQETSNGILKFPFTIKNQFTTTLSTLEGARYLRKELLDWQRDFYSSALKDAAQPPVKAYVFGDGNDEAKTNIFVNMLRRHHINIYELSGDFNSGSGEFKNQKAFIIPVNQPQFRLIRGIFEKALHFQDSLFYDITSWTMPLAFGLPYAELNASQFKPGLLGAKIESDRKEKGSLLGGRSDIGYVIEWTHYFAPAALFELQNAGLFTKVSTNAFKMQIPNSNKKFGYGTILIPVSMQNQPADKIFELVKNIASKYGIDVYSLGSGSVINGSDFGSNRFSTLTKPSVALIVGQGVNALDAGEVWHLMDQRFNIPLSHLEISTFNRINLDKYNTILMVSGNYSEMDKDKLKAWIQGGGVLILMEEAVSWAAQNGISQVSFKRPKVSIDSSKFYNYAEREQVQGAQRMSGAIFRADVDLSHPLAYGYTKQYVSLFKSNSVFMEKSKNPYASPFRYGNSPLISGWLSRQNLDAMKNSAAVIVNAVGSGRVISISENPNLRAFWLEGSKLMMNAVFFGRNINAASARAEE